MKKRKLIFLLHIALTIGILLVATLLGFLFNYLGFHETNVVVVYILSVLLISRFTNGYVYGIVASVISLLLFNFFFTEPFYTFKVNDMTYVITFVIMTATSILTTTLTTKVKQSASDARAREIESKALYKLINHLSDAEGKEAIAEITAKTTTEVLKCSTSFICFNENGDPENTFIYCNEDGMIIRRSLSKGDELKQRLSQLHGSFDVTEEYFIYPIYGNKEILAVMCIPSKQASQLSSSQSRMIFSIIENASLSLDRLRSLEEQVKSREETTQERYRSNLLRSISHDIRTPLSGIIGTSEMLMSKTDENDERFDLASDIYKDAQWLHSLVENILNLTKIQDGKLAIAKQSEALEEVIGAALMAVEKRTANRKIDIQMPDSLVMVSVDAKLISQVLVNLLENAIKFTPGDKEISIIVEPSYEYVNVTVADRGRGIQEVDLPHIFKMFYTTNKKIADSKRGVGLGLAICQSIVEAHGGKIFAKNREGGGASFTFTLPLGGQNNG